MYPHHPYTPFEASSCIAFPPTTGGSDYCSYNAKQPRRVVALGRLRLFEVHLTRPKQEAIDHGELLNKFMPQLESGPSVKTV